MDPPDPEQRLVSRLIWNLSLDQFRQQRQGFLPTEIASLGSAPNTTPSASRILNRSTPSKWNALIASRVLIPSLPNSLFPASAPGSHGHVSGGIGPRRTLRDRTCPPKKTAAMMRAVLAKNNDAKDRIPPRTKLLKSDTPSRGKPAVSLEASRKPAEGYRNLRKFMP